MHIKRTKHDQYVLELCKQILPHYDTIRTHVPILNKKKQTIAEIDILAKKEKNIHIYEVKCSYRPFKARQQLTRLKKIFHNDIEKSFFYCGTSKQLIIMEG